MLLTVFPVKLRASRELLAFDQVPIILISLPEFRSSYLWRPALSPHPPIFPPEEGGNRTGQTSPGLAPYVRKPPISQGVNRTQNPAMQQVWFAYGRRLARVM